ncbi:MAG: hypothetical protein PHO15_05870 [Eubacteriales bacterium]|nr:hypothetical protein [Eubacteriales bacterium]
MTISHYLFVFYVFLLVCAVIWFIGRMTRNKKQDDKSNYEKEQRLFKLYQNVEDMMNGFEEYAEEAKKQIDESVAKALSLLEETKIIHKKSGETDIKSSGDVINRRESRSKAKIPATTEKKQREKTIDMILSLAEEGLDNEKIARELGISSRAVSLILEMRKIKKPKVTQ